MNLTSDLNIAYIFILRIALYASERVPDKHFAYIHFQCLIVHVTFIVGPVGIYIPVKNIHRVVFHFYYSLFHIDRLSLQLVSLIRQHRCHRLNFIYQNIKVLNIIIFIHQSPYILYYSCNSKTSYHYFS